MRKVVNIFYFLSLVLFLITLTLVYANLPSQVGVSVDDRGLPDQFVGRENFFYLALLAGVLTNILCWSLSRFMKLLPVRRSPNKPAFFSNSVLKDAIVNWVKGFGAVLNFAIIATITYLGAFNNSDTFSGVSYDGFLYVGPILIVSWLGVLIFLMVSRRPATS